MPVPQPSKFEDVHCFVCGADDHVVLYEAREQQHGDEADLIHKFRASGDELLIDQLVECRRCSFKYITPRVRGDLILASYAQGQDQAYVSQIAARERTFSRSLLDIERLAGRKGRLLDIGTAAGAFLAVARSQGWQVDGCEPNHWLAEWGSRHYDLPIRVGSLFEQPYEPGTFDVITLWDVIEHTPDPRTVLDRCRDLLRPGGILVVNYPDVGSWIARVLGRRWPFLSSVHLFLLRPADDSPVAQWRGLQRRGGTAARPTTGIRLRAATGQCSEPGHVPGAAGPPAAPQPCSNPHSLLDRSDVRCREAHATASGTVRSRPRFRALNAPPTWTDPSDDNFYVEIPHVAR